MKLFNILFATSFLNGPDASPTAVANAERAQALLERAVSYYQANGEAAFTAFYRNEEFRDGELYVYVLGSDGIMLMSGGPSSVLIGRDVRELRDTEDKAFMREILETAAANGSGVVQYRWLNPQRVKVEPKIAYFRAVGDRVLVTGYYVPRASAEQAKAMLWRAVHELKQSGAKAFDRFNDLNGGFVQDDLYVFVVGLDDMRMHAHGAQPSLIASDVHDLKDADDKPFIPQMVDIGKSRGEGELDYRWKNPVTGWDENKRTYFLRVDNYLVAVGAYQP